ncbi:hypothetical protein P5V15_013934 [Pogonomyrmex californicus]
MRLNAEEANKIFLSSCRPGRELVMSIDTPLVKRALNNGRLIRRKKKKKSGLARFLPANLGRRIVNSRANHLTERKRAIPTPSRRPHGFFHVDTFFYEASRHPANLCAAGREGGGAKANAVEHPDDYCLSFE